MNASCLVLLGQALDEVVEEVDAVIEIFDANAFVFPVLDDHGALCGILSKSDFIKDIPRQLILVDHNELDQAVLNRLHTTL